MIKPNELFPIDHGTSVRGTAQAISEMLQEEHQNTPPEPINPHRTVTELQTIYRMVFDRFLSGDTIIEIASDPLPYALMGIKYPGQIPLEFDGTVRDIIDEEMKRLKARKLANGK